MKRVEDNSRFFAITRFGAIGFCLIANSAIGTSASAKIPNRHTELATTTCHGTITIRTVSNSKLTAYESSLKRWRASAMAKHSRRFGVWPKAKNKIVKIRRDRIEQSWVVTRSGQPCGPRFLTTTKTR